jgi:hypothetical protein
VKLFEIRFKRKLNFYSVFGNFSHPIFLQWVYLVYLGQGIKDQNYRRGNLASSHRYDLSSHRVSMLVTAPPPLEPRRPLMGWTGCFPRRVSLQRLEPANDRRSIPWRPHQMKQWRLLPRLASISRPSLGAARGPLRIGPAKRPNDRFGS